MTVYVERMIATSQTLRCDTCGKFIRWPEEMRVYAQSLQHTPEYIEHTKHPIRNDAMQVGAK